MPATLNEIKHNAQIEFSVVHWKEGNEKRRTFGRSNEAANALRDKPHPPSSTVPLPHRGRLKQASWSVYKGTSDCLGT